MEQPGGGNPPDSFAGWDAGGLLDDGIRPGGIECAMPGSTRRVAMRDSTTAAQLSGKSLKACGKDNVPWGTDSIWYGSPQDQIQPYRERPDPAFLAYGPKTVAPLRRLLGWGA
jgi:hypothetical protein